MKYSKSFLQGLRDKVNIADVVGNYVNLERQGSPKYLWGVCPFHDDTNPSFTVQPRAQRFHCFGCHKSGDVFQFLVDYLNISFPQAITRVAHYAGIKLPDSHQRPRPVDPQKARVIQLNDQVAKMYHHVLVDTQVGEKGLSYLHQRGISDDTINEFGLGYAPQKSILVSALKSQGFSEQTILNSKIMNRYGKPRFYDRIIIPVRTFSGHVIGFSGRTVGKVKAMKYMNVPDTIAFKRDRTLFNLNDAVKHQDKTKTLVLFEGFMDVFAASQSGVKNSISSLGTSLTPKQVKELRWNAHRVYICYDGDDAGQRATERAIGLFQRYAPHIHIGIIQMPKDTDPDEYRKRHSERSLASYLKHEHKSTTSFKLNYASRSYDLNRPNGQARFLERAASIIARVHSPIRRDLYVNLLADYFHVQARSLHETINADIAKTRAAADYQDSFKPVAQTKLPNPVNVYHSELQLMALILQDEHVLTWVQASHGFQFVSDGLEAIYSVIEQQSSQSKFDVKDVVSSLKSPRLKHLVHTLCQKQVPSNVDQSEIKGYMNGISGNFEFIRNTKSLRNVAHEFLRLGEHVASANTRQELNRLTWNHVHS